MSEAQGLMRGKRGLIMGAGEQPLHRLGNRQGSTRPRGGTGFHLSGRRAAQAGRAAGGGSGRHGASAIATSPSPATLDAAFAALRTKWGSLDFLVHAIAFSDKDELDGRYIDTTQDNFIKTMVISCYSFTAVAQRAEKLMTNGGSMLTLTYYGAEKWMPHYNRHGRRQGGARSLGALYGGRSRHQEHPRQRDFGGTDQDAGGVGHRRFPLYPEVERVQHAAAAERDDRRGRRYGGVFPVGYVARRHR